MNRPNKPIKRRDPPQEYYDYYCDEIKMEENDLRNLITGVLNAVGADFVDLKVYDEGCCKSTLNFYYKNLNYEQELAEYNKRDEVYAAELEQYEKDLAEYKKFAAADKVRNLQERLKKAQEELKEFES